MLVIMAEKNFQSTIIREKNEEKVRELQKFSVFEVM